MFVSGEVAQLSHLICPSRVQQTDLRCTTTTTANPSTSPPITDGSSGSSPSHRFVLSSLVTSGLIGWFLHKWSSSCDYESNDDKVLVLREVTEDGDVEELVSHLREHRGFRSAKMYSSHLNTSKLILEKWQSSQSFCVAEFSRLQIRDALLRKNPSSVSAEDPFCRFSLLELDSFKQKNKLG
eukprot:GHVS01061203.1.p1 GENE.GHVS01061203.1~~GHVS01061203.1.p1  ORF type:complete len:182 (+),score=31.57 GHVS01061203.1:3366-3911(+)